jgi:hypothetical protein
VGADGRRRVQAVPPHASSTTVRLKGASDIAHAPPTVAASALEELHALWRHLATPTW